MAPNKRVPGHVQMVQTFCKDQVKRNRFSKLFPSQKQDYNYYFLIDFLKLLRKQIWLIISNFLADHCCMLSVTVEPGGKDL